MNNWALFLIAIMVIAGVGLAIEQTTTNEKSSQSISLNNSSQNSSGVNYSEMDVQMKKLWY